MENLKLQQKELLIKPFNVPIYDWTIVLLIGEENDALDLIKTKECTQIYNDPPGEYLGSVIQPNSTIYIWYPPDSDITVKAHEILHATYRVLESVGVDITDQEAVCYLFEYIFRQCLDLENE